MRRAKMSPGSSSTGSRLIVAPAAAVIMLVMAEYYLMTACDSIALAPTGQVVLSGVSAMPGKMIRTIV